jgi:hypothetical protein
MTPEQESLLYKASAFKDGKSVTFTLGDAKAILAIDAERKFLLQANKDRSNLIQDQQRELITSLNRAEQAGSALCRAREAYHTLRMSAQGVPRDHVLARHYVMTTYLEEMGRVLGWPEYKNASPTPCPHAERVKQLEEAVEWALGESPRYSRSSGECIGWEPIIELKIDRDELRRRAGKEG